MPAIRDFLDELEQEADGTKRTLERVCNQKLTWKPHEKSLSLGQLALHIATLPGALAEISMLPAFDAATVIPRPEAKNVDELLAAHAASITRAREILGGMDDAALETPWTIVMGSKEIARMPRGQFLRSVLFNHWYHHRGQLTVYLRETGALVPAIYGPSADEVPFQM
ncbi:MAG TPA: DinB family protein [Gemmatimonadaceae bacterium]|nr:DinB family protein [Gemmatimonadaceae bacterium]